MRLLTSLLLVIFFAWPLAGQAEEYRAVTSVAVMPFVKIKGDKTVWLDKALSDLVAQKLSESTSYAVLNRDTLQVFLKEMQFQQSGFVDDKQAIQRVGKIAKMDEVFYGNYTLEGNHIAIHLVVMDVASQTIVKEQDISGTLNELIPLSERLVTQFFESKKIALSPQEKTNIAFAPTDSFSAIEHFYNGLHAYDQGDYETAMGEFYASGKQDPQYLDAKLWFARMLEQLGRDAEAVIAYQQLYTQAPQSIEGIDARYFAGRLQARTDPDAAIKTYQSLVDIRPELPETLEASYQQAKLYRSQGKSEQAYIAYKQIDDFSENVRKHAESFRQQRVREETSAFTKFMQASQKAFSKNQANVEQTQDSIDCHCIALLTRHSRFFDWQHPLGLYREAITGMVELYRDLPINPQGVVTYAAPRGSFVIDPANPVIKGTMKEKNKSLFGGDHTYQPDWKEIFYAVIIPKGYKAVGTHLQITGRLLEPTPTRDYTLRVLPFPLTQNYHNSWLGVIYGQTPTTATLTKDISFFGKDQHLLAVQVIENYSQVDNWEVKVILHKEEAETAVQPANITSADTEGALLAKVKLGSADTHTIQSMPIYTMQLQPKHKLALASNMDEGLWLVGVKGELYGQETDLWSTHSEDHGKTWAKAEAMSVNSASLEFAPSLVRAEDGSLQLFFLSNRRSLGWEIWTSRQDPKSKRWEHAKLVPVRDFAPTGLENRTDFLEKILPYAVMQDSHGTWMIASYSEPTRQLVIIASDDLEHWHKHAAIALDGITTIAFNEDNTGKYYLVTVDGTGKPQIRNSNDAKTWESVGTIQKTYYDYRAISPYPMTLLKREGEGMLLLFSDIATGLQYAPVSGTGVSAIPDLVTYTGLEPYAVAPVNNAIIAALWKDDNISIQHYRKFAFAENGSNAPDSNIYTERSLDKEHGIWDRIFARERYKVPDVTAVGVSPEGRAWWGVEAGVMALKGEEYLFSDVSLGFFSHYIDIIKTCGDTTWFASTVLGVPQVGYSMGRHPSLLTVSKSLRLDELHSNITAIACGTANQTYFGSEHGEVLVYDLDKSRHSFVVPKNDEQSITALAFDAHAKRLVAGTSRGILYSMNSKGEFINIANFENHKINALATDSEGHIWVAVEDKGITVLDTHNAIVKTYAAPAIPISIKKLVSDPQSGVWAMADNYSVSLGLMHMDLAGVAAHNPAQHVLWDIIDFDISDDRSIWIGTNSEGIYHYKRAL